MQKRRKFQSPQGYVQVMTLLRSDAAGAVASTLRVFLSASYVPAHMVPLFAKEPTGNNYRTTSESRDLYLLTLVNPHGS